MSIIDKSGIHRTIRALEKFDAANAAKIEVGSFKQDGIDYKIRVQRNHCDPDGNVIFSTVLDIQMPSSSGLVFVPIGEFNVMHKDAFPNYVPKIRIDSSWISYNTSKNQYKTACEVSCKAVKSHVSRWNFNIINANTPDEMLNDLEGQIFQHNLVCSAMDIIDEEYMKSAFEFVLEEFDAMYENDVENQITSVDFMPKRILVQSGLEFNIPYDLIAQEIENYVQTKQTKQS